MPIKLSEKPVLYRRTLTPADRQKIEKMVHTTGFFNPEEVDIAIELVDENLAKGEQKSGYSFLLAEVDNQLVGYSSYGLIPGTISSYDLYWIVVDKTYQRHHIGSRLLKETEKIIAELKGTRIYVETSGKPLYESTRQFYLKNHYNIEAVLKDFYGPKDDKIILAKNISTSSCTGL